MHNIDQQNSSQDQSQDHAKFSNIISGFSHSFDTGIALELGLNAAIVYNHIYYWVERNSKTKDAEMIDGRYWMYESQKEMADFLGYLSEDEIQRAIKKLLDAGLIVKGNFNKNVFNRTNWYSINVPIKKSFTKPQKCGIDSRTGAGSETADLRNPIPQNDGMYNKVKDNKQEEQHKNTTPTPPNKIHSDFGGGGLEKSSVQKIEYTNIQGQKCSVTETDIFGYFIKAQPTFTTDLILEAIEILKNQTDPIRCVFKYLDAIIQRLTKKSSMPKKKNSAKLSEIDDSDIPYYGKETYVRGIFL